MRLVIETNYLHSFAGFPTLFEVRTVLDSGVYYGDVYAIGDVDYEAFARISFNVLVSMYSAVAEAPAL